MYANLYIQNALRRRYKKLSRLPAG